MAIATSPNNENLSVSRSDLDDLDDLVYNAARYCTYPYRYCASTLRYMGSIHSFARQWFQKPTEIIGYSEAELLDPIKGGGGAKIRIQTITSTIVKPIIGTFIFLWISMATARLILAKIWDKARMMNVWKMWSIRRNEQKGNHKRALPSIYRYFFRNWFASCWKNS